MQTSLSSLVPILFEQGHTVPFEGYQHLSCCDLHSVAMISLILVTREGFALLFLVPDTVDSHSANSRPRTLPLPLDHQKFPWWPWILARKSYLKMETESYLLAFDPRCAWKAYGAWITLYNKNIQNHHVSLEHDKTTWHVGLHIFSAFFILWYEEVANRALSGTDVFFFFYRKTTEKATVPQLQPRGAMGIFLLYTT